MYKGRTGVWGTCLPQPPTLNLYSAISGPDIRIRGEAGFQWDHTVLHVPSSPLEIPLDNERPR